jgi:hypothetical protein
MLSLGRKSAIILACVLSISCADKFGRLAQISNEVSKATVQLQTNEIESFAKGEIPLEVHKEANKTFEGLGHSIKALNTSIRTASSVGVRAAGADIKVTIDRFSKLLPVSSGLQVWLTIVNNLIATMLALL